MENLKLYGDLKNLILEIKNIKQFYKKKLRKKLLIQGLVMTGSMVLLLGCLHSLGLNSMFISIISIICGISGVNVSLVFLLTLENKFEYEKAVTMKTDELIKYSYILNKELLKMDNNNVKNDCLKLDDITDAYVTDYAYEVNKDYRIPTFEKQEKNSYIFLNSENLMCIKQSKKGSYGYVSYNYDLLNEDEINEILVHDNEIQEKVRQKVKR